MFNLRFFGVLLICPALAGCGGKEPPAGASIERFEAYYSEEIFLTERSRLTGVDSLELGRQLDSLRSVYALTAGARDSLLAYLRDSLPGWEAFLTAVARRLDDRGTMLKTPEGPPAETHVAPPDTH